MKRILLFAALFAVGLTSNAQSADFNESFPDGWIVNRDLKIAKYDNPLTGVVDTGMVTAPINIGPTPNAGLHLVTTDAVAYTATSNTINVSFDAFAFKGDTRNYSKQDFENNFKCNTSLKAFLVPATYTSTAIPTGSNNLGESAFVSLKNGANALSINVTGTLVAGQSYRVLVVGRVQGNCNNGLSQSYVIDNFVIGESIFSQNFNGTTLPTGWSLFEGLELTNYNTPLPACSNGRGLATPAITVTPGTRLITAPIAVGSANTESVRVQFDLFAFNANANFECASAQQALTCSTRLTIYIVDASNTSTGAVPTGTIYGRSEAELLAVGANDIDIEITTALTPGTPYKLYVVGSSDNCNGNAQRYVLDNVAVLNEVDEEDFSNAFPTGWDFNRDFKLSQYCGLGNQTDIGLITPQIVTNVPSNYLMATPATQYAPTTGSLTISFNLFAFKFDTRGFECFDKQETLRCKTSVKVYLVAGTYTGTNVPSASQILGQSEWTPLQLENLNNIVVPVNGTFNANLTYRLLVFGRTEDCPNLNGQLNVIDNIRIAEQDRAILPVTFASFNAQRNKSKVELTWETAMEENNRGFHVQRNIDGTWKNIGFVFSQATGGNSTSTLSYSFNDVNSSRGITQYRLLQVDNDNKGRYSEVRSVRAENQLSKIMVYPNPSNTGNVSMMFDEASSVRDVIVSDVAGRVVKQYRNVNSNSLTIENLVDGYYTIQITNRTTAATTVEKVIIKKR